MEEQKNPVSEFAIASLVVGVASFISLAGIEKAIIAIVFGVLALKRLECNEQLSGKNLAKAGIVLSIVSIIATVVFIIKVYPKIQQRMIELQSESAGGNTGDSQVGKIPGVR